SLIAGQIKPKSQSARVPLHFSEIIVVSDFRNLRISFSITLYIRKAVGRFRVRPPIRSLAHVVMFVAAWWDPVFVHDRERPFFHGATGGFTCGSDKPAAGAMLLLLGQCLCVEQENPRQPVGALLLRARTWAKGKANYEDKKGLHRRISLPAMHGSIKLAIDGQ